jgi:hypothetical protein
LQAAGRSPPTIWKRLLCEIRETAAATVGQTARLVRYGKALWRKKTLRRSAVRALAVLGERAYAAGVGPAELRAQIAALDGQISGAEAVKSPTGPFRQQRRVLVAQLADDLSGCATLPPPVGAAVAWANKARVAAEQHETVLRGMRARLSPQHGAGWRRIGVGYAVLAGGLLLAFRLLGGGTKAATEVVSTQLGPQVSRAPDDKSRGAEPVDEQDPVYRGRPLSEWIQMLKDERLGIRRSAAVDS